MTEDSFAQLLAERDRLRDRVKDMEDDVRTLDALRAAGVDSWEGYGYAMELRDEADG